MEMLIALSFIYLATIPFAIRRFNAMRRRTPRGSGVAATQAPPFRKREHDRRIQPALGCSANALPDDECTSIKASRS